MLEENAKHFLSVFVYRFNEGTYLFRFSGIAKRMNLLGSKKILANIAINRSRKISGSEMNGNFANLGERVQRSEPVNCC